MSERKAGIWMWTAIGTLSVLIPIGLYFVAYWLVADVIVMGGGVFGGYPQASVIYHVGDYEFGGWAESVFSPAAYVDRKVLRRSHWSEDEQPPEGYVDPHAGMKMGQMGGGMLSGPLEDLPPTIST
jgi:hypothetical protein